MDNLRFLLASQEARDAARRGHYGVILRLVRQGTGLTQAQAGHLAGYSAATISRFETGARRLTDIATLRHLAAVLEVTPEIFGLTACIPESSRTPGRASTYAGTSLATVVTGSSLDGSDVRRRELLSGLTGLSAAALLRATRAAAATGTGPASSGLTATAGTDAAALSVPRESVQLALEAEGPAGGPQAREQLAAAVRYYDLNFSRFWPALLAAEVHRTRSMTRQMLRHSQPDTACQELRRSMGWLSALAGNLAFMLADHTAALIHLGTSARLGTAAGDDDLVCWSLGAQAMTANADGRHAEALELARSAYDYAHTPLRRAQILAWAELHSLAGLGDQHRADASRVMAMAQRQMAADQHGERPGRFGFDLAEMRLHLAEATLALGDHAQARKHALASAAHTTPGRPGWAAATLVLARGEAARGNNSDAAALGRQVLDAIPPEAIRETSRVRLRDLDADLFAEARPSTATRELRDRLRALPPLLPAIRQS
jgi:transcriptional regulator with XRE-family HTH domain